MSEERFWLGITVLATFIMIAAMSIIANISSVETHLYSVELEVYRARLDLCSQYQDSEQRNVCIAKIK